MINLFYLCVKVSKVRHPIPLNLLQSARRNMKEDLNDHQQAYSGIQCVAFCTDLSGHANLAASSRTPGRSRQKTL